MKFIKKITDPFIHVCVGSSNPDAVIIVCWVQAKVQDRRLFTAEKGALLGLDISYKHTTIPASRVELGEVIIDS